MGTETPTTGRAKTLLVFGHEPDAVGVVSAVTARVLADCSPRGTAETAARGLQARPRARARLRFAGPATFDAAVRRHASAVILPAVDGILNAIEVCPKRYEVSMVNLGAASAADIGLAVSGFSADAAMFLALLSASLVMPIPSDVVVTGHVASRDGDMRAVGELPSKLAAAIADPSVATFIYPSLDLDSSLASLSRAEAQRAAEAIFQSKDQIRAIAVNHVADLLRAVLCDETIIQTSLQQGFFRVRDHREGDRPAPIAAVRVLAADLEHRFWATLERLLLDGQSDRAASVLTARARFEINRKTYPAGVGGRLLQLLGSVPPATRRVKMAFPLLPMKDCIELSQFAGGGDHEDVRLLLDAAGGRGIGGEAGAAPEAEQVSAPQAGAAALDAVLAEISSDALARQVGLPVDTARAAYQMATVTAESYDQGKRSVAAFYLHLFRHTHNVVGPADMRSVEADALDLLGRAFAKRGGVDAAFAEIRHGTGGGLRLVLDVMTEQFKVEEQRKHVNWVLKSALNPLEWGDRVAFMAALLARLGPHLPEDVKSQPPDRFAKHFESVVRHYVESLDSVKTLLRAL